MANELLKKVADLTELPSEEISEELDHIVASNGFNPERASLDDLRAAMLQYLDEIFAKEETFEYFEKSPKTYN